jgi:hypothetical protein
MPKSTKPSKANKSLDADSASIRTEKKASHAGGEWLLGE